ncbi:MAG TPA: SDR family NAD(P)-dependent oxidoreductase, partial [Pseudonocardia sp.]|nr:SDR family NAD(P)-dependent oxidoreductase [Pseudonocardia sp.]
MASRTALITGVSRPLGIGFAVAQQLVEQGYHVILTARDVSKAEQLAAQLRPGVATALRLDLADPTSVAEAADQVAQTFGHLDVLINNASFFPDHTALSALDADLNAVRSALEIDVIGPWGLILALLPLLKKAPAARIVNVSSVAASQISTAGTAADGLFRAPAHSLAKYTLNVLTTVLAGALADTPILVNAVDPGETATHPER